MATVCDLCKSAASMHICERCYKIAKQLLEIYEKQSKEAVENAPPAQPKKKRGRPKKEKPIVQKKPRGRPRKDAPMKEPVSDREKEWTEKKKTNDPILSPCWTCELAFIGPGGKVACSDGKEPETCGKK